MLPLEFIRKHKDDIHTLGYMITVLIAIAGFIMVINQMQLQTAAIRLQIEAVKTQNEGLKLQTEVLQAQNEQMKFQRDAVQSQLNLNKPIITQNVHCPPLQPNTVNHAEYTVYNSGRSSGVYNIKFQSDTVLMRAMSFNCVTFSNLCASNPDHAISTNDKETYMLDLRIGDNVVDPRFNIKVKCMSEDCAKDPEKTWTCRYSYNNETKNYEPVASGG